MDKPDRLTALVTMAQGFAELADKFEAEGAHDAARHMRENGPRLAYALSDAIATQGAEAVGRLFFQVLREQGVNTDAL